MTDATRISGFRLIGELPDQGPWRLTVFAKTVYAMSQHSGRVFAVEDQLREVIPVPAIDTSLSPAQAMAALTEEERRACLVYTERTMTVAEVRETYGLHAIPASLIPPKAR